MIVSVFYARGQLNLFGRIPIAVIFFINYLPFTVMVFSGIFIFFKIPNGLFYLSC
jgi:hypothetical protein